MRLDEARLCLDCEEVHEEHRCPRCGSEAFAFLTRWIELAGPRVERPARARTAELERSPAQAEQVEAYRQLLSPEPAPRRGGLLAKSLVGLAAFGLAGWAMRAAKRDGGTRKEERRTKSEEEERSGQTLEE